MNRVARPTEWYKRLMAEAYLKGDKTQQDVANRLGVSKATITNWKGGMRPDPQRVMDAARVYGADLLELLSIAYVEEEKKPKKRRIPKPPEKYEQDPGKNHM